MKIPEGTCPSTANTMSNREVTLPVEVFVAQLVLITMLWDASLTQPANLLS